MDPICDSLMGRYLCRWVCTEKKRGWFLAVESESGYWILDTLT